ncbi:Fc receptor-like protein 2 [Polyodon spathula]|uniref:Fc receptor-like protein 2 n=1 Tax=Polyodon spathula TaxID=7913 RepID=UPI001B7DDA05|nr:Fc receptor-like protein 2 [Polyodon spathula]
MGSDPAVDVPAEEMVTGLTTLTGSGQSEEKRVTLQIEPRAVFEGDTLTLSCLVRYGYKPDRIEFYKDNIVLQSQAGKVLRMDHVPKRDEGSYKCRVWWRSIYFLDSAEVWVSVRELFSKPTLTFTLVSPVWEGDAVTLQCAAQIYKQGTQLQYRYSKEGTDLRGSGSHDQHSIPAAGLRDTGKYQCEVEAAGTGLVKKTSDPVSLTVRELFSKPTLIFSPVSPVWEGEAVTLQCAAQIYKQGTQLQYRYSKEGTDLRGSGSQDQHSIPAAGLRDTGRYQCEVEAAGTGLVKKTSDHVSLTVRDGQPKPALSQKPDGEICEGDPVTLSCVVEGGFGGWRYLWYRDRQGAPVYQRDSSSGAGYTISAAALSHSGEYWCRAERERTSLHSQYSDPIRVNVTALFSRVTLTATPGVTVKEGEPLNLTCEAAVNKPTHPQLHYSIMRDGEPVTNSTDSALYSIASTEKSHTGSYKCAVESQGVRKSSQELHIEVQNLPSERLEKCKGAFG